MFSNLLGLISRVSPDLKRLAYHSLYEYLNGRYSNVDWPFINYGFADLDGNAPRLLLHRGDEYHRYQIQLYDHVTRRSDLRGHWVLEVGCGRGGGASYVRRYLHPCAVVGVDFSRQAIEFCARRHRLPGVFFLTAEAEALPFAAETFDAVINVESSHCYACMEGFLSEVRRVLKPQGHLFFADLRSRYELPVLSQQLRRCGLRIVHEEIITPNVLRALDLDNTRKHGLIDRWVSPLFRHSMGNFLRLRGTPAYEALRKGHTAYVHYIARKERQRRQ